MAIVALQPISCKRECNKRYVLKPVLSVIGVFQMQTHKYLNIA